MSSAPDDFPPTDPRPVEGDLPHPFEPDRASVEERPLWGGRFAEGPAKIMEAINASIDFDKRLARQDIDGSIAHCQMLITCGILSAEDGNVILEGLAKVDAEIQSGTLTFSRVHEDIHMNVEARLHELVGPVAGRLHTARSRNDQVATDFKLWVRQAFDEVDAGVKRLQQALIEQAEVHAGTLCPGYTHLQMAQPVTLGHHFLAYVEMFGRDRSRLADARRRLNECPLGSAALAGTPYPIDRDQTAAALGFDRPTANSLDAVSDRDFALEYLACASILAMHLSRMAEELVLWVCGQFAFIRLPDELSTGSSIMPQKRNPDAAELIRGKTGRVFGHLQSLLTTMKGLPLAYSKDLQEDKEPVFDTQDTLALCLEAATGMLSRMEVYPARMEAAAKPGYPTATDLADWLVRTLGVPFREAHHITGRIVHLAEEVGVDLEQLSLVQLHKVDPRITADVYQVLGLRASVESRTSYGGTATTNVLAQCKAARERFLT